MQGPVFDKEQAMSSMVRAARILLPPIRNFLPRIGLPVLAGSRTRPLWFDGRFLAAPDMQREQYFFLQRQAELGRAAGFGILHGLWVDQGATIPQPADAETIVIHAGVGITPSGQLVMISSDLTIRLSDLPEEENLDVEFGLSEAPQQPARTRTGLYIIAARPLLFTANPITFYPASLQSPRRAQDGDVVEATGISLVPYTNPVNAFDSSLQQAALARQIFVNGEDTTLSKSLLPLAMVSIDRNVIQWIDPYLVRRDSGPKSSAVRFGLADPAVQQAFLLQYDAMLQAVVAGRNAKALRANFAATDYFQALPSAARLPLDAINVTAFTQVFFPQQMKVQLAIIPADELPAVLEDSLSLPPIDLTQPAATFANMSVYVLISVPRNGFAALASTLTPVALNPALPQVFINRLPLQFMRGFSSRTAVAAPAPAASSSWESAINGQTYGFYVVRRSEPVFVDFSDAAALAAHLVVRKIPAGETTLATTTQAPAAATTRGLRPRANAGPRAATTTSSTTAAPSTTAMPLTTTTPAPAGQSPKTTTRKAAPTTTPKPAGTSK
jgi:hypothetical protein